MVARLGKSFPGPHLSLSNSKRKGSLNKFALGNEADGASGAENRPPLGAGMPKRTPVPDESDLILLFVLRFERNYDRAQIPL